MKQLKHDWQIDSLAREHGTIPIDSLAPNCIISSMKKRRA